MPEKLNFEESLQKLEEIAEKLEQGNINLDESVELYAQANGGESGAKGGAGCIIFSSD